MPDRVLVDERAQGAGWFAVVAGRVAEGGGGVPGIEDDTGLYPNGHSHLRAGLLSSSSQTVPIVDGNLMLAEWLRKTGDTGRKVIDAYRAM